MTDSQSVPDGRAGRGARDTKRELVEAARRLFVERGYAKTSVAAIVRAAGVAQGTFYLYFKSKDEVLARLRGEVLREYLAAFAGADGGARADERLVRGLERIYRAVRKNRPLVRVFRQAASGEETVRVWLEGRRALATPLGELVAAGVAEGAFRVDDARMAAHLALALFDDLLYDALEYGEPASGKQTLLHGTRFLLRALGSPEARVEALVPLPARRRS